MGGPIVVAERVYPLRLAVDRARVAGGVERTVRAAAANRVERPALGAGGPGVGANLPDIVAGKGLFDAEQLAPGARIDRPAA